MTLTTFDLESASRIAGVVRAVEGQPQPGSSLSFDSVPPGPRRVFRVATFTGSWSKSATKTVTLINKTSTPNTVVATNLFANVPASGRCAIARDGTAWYLIAAEC